MATLIKLEELAFLIRHPGSRWPWDSWMAMMKPGYALEITDDVNDLWPLAPDKKSQHWQERLNSIRRRARANGMVLTCRGFRAFLVTISDGANG